MQQVYIPAERLRELKRDKKLVTSVERVCGCKLEFADDYVEVSSEDAYKEFSAKNVVFAFGRGFELKDAELLAHDDYYFSTIDLGDIFGNNKKRLHNMKSRIIGESGRTKIYIESVSGVKISVYGDTVSFIGSSIEISEAETAVSTLIEGSTHKLAYARMEAAHRKNKTRAHDPSF